VSTQQRIVTFGAAALLVVAGIVTAALGGGTAQVFAIVLIGVGLVAAVSLVFFEVGRSEDAERAREARRTTISRPRPRSGQASPGGRPKPRLTRNRGGRRRLPRDQ
jgi:hypothetical protein